MNRGSMTGEPLRVRAGGLVLCALLVACSGTGSDWLAEHERSHPLVGRIWDVRAGVFLAEDAWLRELAGRSLVLLGEKHDHPDHHRIQARVIRALTEVGRRPRVALELFQSDRQPAIDAVLRADPTAVDALREAGGFQDGETVRWDAYRPVLAAAVAAGLPIVAADLPRSLVLRLREADAREAARRSLGAELYDALELDAPLAEETRVALVEQIREAHCGHAPAALLPRMIRAQRLRDAFLARALVDASPADGAILIAGLEHVRRDRGVPAGLALLRGEASSASVALVEVARGERDPARYDEAALFDYLLFTPVFDPRDPCERFRDALRGMEERS